MELVRPVKARAVDVDVSPVGEQAEAEAGPVLSRLVFAIVPIAGRRRPIRQESLVLMRFVRSVD